MVVHPIADSASREAPYSKLPKWALTSDETAPVAHCLVDEFFMLDVHPASTSRSVR